MPGSLPRPAACLLAPTMIVATVALLAGPVHAAVPLQLVYGVSHSAFGDLGSFTSTIEPIGNGATTVLTQEHLEVRVLGVRMYREDTESTERWQGNRLVSFYGVTNKPGESAVVRGEARGDSFVIASPQGTVTAPATVHLANPCSPDFLSSTTILHPDTGSLEQVRVTGGARTSVSIDGATIPARKYEIDGKTRYTVWVDSHNVPVMFAVDNATGKVTFSLAKCVGCSPPIS
jgi:hypothetical protein